MLITDHQPLLSMFNNPNSRPPARIEYWLLYFQRLDYIMEYQPGKFNPTDYLSHRPQKNTAEFILLVTLEHKFELITKEISHTGEQNLCINNFF